MLKTWPDNLPLFSLDWSFKQKDNFIKNQSERGPIKIRKKSSISINQITGSIEYDENQLTTFLNFLNNEIQEGANPFNINDFISNKVQKAWLKSWTVKKVSINSYKIDLTIEVENR